MSPQFPVRPLSGVARAPRAVPRSAPVDQDQRFSDTLSRALAGAPSAKLALRWSGHAQQRLTQASRTLSGPETARVEGAVGRAAEKGARAALVVLDDLALVVNISSRTVITVVTPDRMAENVFTNIDAAVLA